MNESRLPLWIVFCVLMLSQLLTAQHSRIAGVVLDSMTLHPLAGANVFVSGTQIGASANNEGKFLLAPLEPGVYRVQFSYVGYSGTDRTVSVSTTDSVWLTVVLSPTQIESQLVVVTGTRTSRAIADVPVRVEAIPQEEVEEKILMSPSSVAMLLNESTGMRVQTTSAVSSASNLRIQGLSGRYTQILNNGIPSLGGLASGFGITQLLPLDLRQVEVVKGATSALYGADAIAGVVNFLPKIPGDIEETNFLINGTTQKGYDIAVYHSQKLRETGLSLLLSRNRQPLFDVDDDGFADVAEYTRTTITPRMEIALFSGVNANVGFTYSDEQRRGGAMGESSPSGSSNSYPVETINTRRFEASAHIDWAYSSNRSFLIKSAWQKLERDAKFGTTPFTANQNVIFADAQYSIDADIHKLLVGSALRIDEFDDRSPGYSQRSYRFTVPSIFFQDEVEVLNAVTLLASGRVDFHNIYGSFFVPRFSLMYRFSPFLTARFGGGTGYKVPTIFTEEAEEIGFRNVRPIRGAKPEVAQSVSFDVNYRSVINGIAIDGNGAVFLTNLHEALLADPDSLRVGIIYLRNATGRTRAFGGELSVRITYEEFKLTTGYTYIYATQTDRGRVAEIDLNPRHAVSIIAFWEDDEHELKLGLENYWVGRQSVGQNPFREVAPSYWITGFVAEKGFGILRVFVNLENIFDTRQTRFEPIAARDPTSGVSRVLPIYAPLEGRVINAGIRLHLSP